MKKFTFYIVSAVILVFSRISFANLINVPEDVQTIQGAIDMSVDGDTVLVAPGRYFENINFKGRNILVTSHFMISGSREDIYNTIIDGSQPLHPDTTSCVLIVNGETRDAVLQGFYITRGKGTKWVDEHGAGTYVEGGGILITFSSPTVKYNVIINNEAVRAGGDVVSAGGGAIRCGDGSPLIANNIIENNKGLYGGGIVMNYASGVIKNNIIKNNQVILRGATPTFGGGGIWIYSEGPVIVENNTIIGNSSLGFGDSPAGKGGGMVIWNAQAKVYNNILWSNTQNTGNQLLSYAALSTVEFNDIQDGFNGEGNISIDPVFLDGTYYLDSSSPCIDAGNPDPEYNDPEDDGSPGSALWPAKGNLRNDIGAYGGPLCSVVEDVPTSADDIGSTLPADFTLGQNYPNPFNPSTTIKYSIPVNSRQYALGSPQNPASSNRQPVSVSLKVYNILGKEAAVLVNKQQQPGTYEVNFDAGNLASGTYFYRLTAGGYTSVKKMLLLR